MNSENRSVTIENGEDAQASAWGLLKGLIVLGLILWGGWAWWQLRTARKAGESLRESVARAWPEDEMPGPGTRRRLLLSAGRIGEGDFRAVVASLRPIDALTAAQQDAARRFLAKRAELSGWFVALAADAAAFEQSDGDAGAVREELARALLAAGRGDGRAVAAHLDVAEKALEEAELGVGAPAAGSGAARLAAQLRAIEPAVKLGREMMLEGHAAVESLLRRAAASVRNEDYRQAGRLVRLAAKLSGTAGSAGVATEEDAELPAWFVELDPPEAPKADAEVAKAAVELGRAAAASLEASEPIDNLLDRAERALRAEDYPEAAWFAGVALKALGIEQSPPAKRPTS